MNPFPHCEILSSNPVLILPMTFQRHQLCHNGSFLLLDTVASWSTQSITSLGFTPDSPALWFSFLPWLLSEGLHLYIRKQHSLILGPLLFFIYIFPSSDLIWFHDLKYHLYANGCQVLSLDSDLSPELLTHIFKLSFWHITWMVNRHLKFSYPELISRPFSQHWEGLTFNQSGQPCSPGPERHRGSHGVSNLCLQVVNFIRKASTHLYFLKSKIYGKIRK